MSGASNPVQGFKPATLATVRDSMLISKPRTEAFKALTDAQALATWWPKEAESEPRKDGKLVFHWFNGAKSLVTSYDVFEPDTRLAYRFGPEEVTFTLEDIGPDTKVTVAHSEISTEKGSDHVVHIAQSWAFLLCNLKAALEKDWDLRPAQRG